MTPASTRSLELMTEEERAFHTCRDREMLSATDEAGRTLLHIAAQGGKAAICRLYLNAGIDPSKVDNAGRTAADLAKLAGYASLSRSLENAIGVISGASGPASISGYDHPLDVREQRALIAGDAEVLVGLISAKRLDSRNAKGDAPLHLAAAGGHLLLCSQLFEAGADTSSRNNNGQTAADMASEAGHRQLAEMLRGLNHERLEPGAQAEPPVAGAEGEYTDAPNPEIDALGELDFDTEEEPVAFHARQGIDAVSATFVAIPSGSGLRAGDSADSEDWELPSSLVKVRATDHVADSATEKLAGATAGLPDFSSPNGRSSRRPRKLKSTRFAIDESACRRWVRDTLATGEADDQAIRDLVGECRGNQSPDELTVNVHKALAAAGIRTEESAEPFLQLPSPSTSFVDEDDLVEAIVAACTRNTVVPGRQVFSVDRATEERLVREISNARHELLNAILDNPALLAAIVLRGEQVLEGEIAVEAFTDLEIEVADDEDIDEEFSANLGILREAGETGISIGGRARRRAMDALDGLELARSCLNDLAQGSGERTGSTIGRLLAACDRSTETFLLAHLPFARRETAKMALPDEDPEELFQESYFALRRAVERFDPDRGVRFYLYALFWIRQQISRWRMNNMSLIRVPVHRYELNSKISAFREEFAGQFHCDPTDLEISEHLECEVKAIKSIALALSKPLEFHQVMSGRADAAESPEGLAAEHQSERLIRNKLNSLTPREEAIIRMRFGIGLRTDMTLEEIGEIYDVTRERIRQIEAKALRKLKHPTRSRLLEQLR
jgi:RNA polymerase primary sigma factor